MSQLKTTSLSHKDNNTGTPNITMYPDGTTSLPGMAMGGFRNQIRNPFFAVWQRSSPIVVTNPGTSYSSTFGADGWSVRGSTGGTSTLSKGIPGGTIMSTYMSQVNSGHTDRFYLRQQLESVTTLAGQTVTLTVKLQSSVAFSLDPILDQRFGKAASASPNVETSSIEGAQEVSAGSIQTLSWTFNLPSIEGKTIDKHVDSVVQVLIWSTAAVNGTIQWIGVQLEPGPVASVFEFRPIGIELSLCQRYFIAYKNDSGVSGLRFITGGYGDGSNRMRFSKDFPTTMRLAPTVSFSGNWQIQSGGSGFVDTTVSASVCTKNTLSLFATRNDVGATGALIFKDSTAAAYADAEL